MSEEKKKGEIISEEATLGLPLPESIECHYLKSNFFRVVHGDGTYGGITPQGKIHMAFFSERNAIPQKVVYQIENGSLGSEIDREGKVGLVREVEVDVVLDSTKAKALHVWLGKWLEKAEREDGEVKE